MYTCPDAARTKPLPHGLKKVALEGGMSILHCRGVINTTQER